MFKTILVPVDIEDVETARPALDRAVALADASGGTVRLIYVRSLVPMAYMEFVPPDFDAAQQEDVTKRLAALADGVSLPKARVSSVVTLGGVYHDVLKEADEDRRRSDRRRIAPPDHGHLPSRLERGQHRAARQMLGAGDPVGLGRFNARARAWPGRCRRS